MRTIGVALALVLLAAPVLADGPATDPLVQALTPELNRSLTGLARPDMGTPYFIEYAVHDFHTRGVECSLGSVVSRQDSRMRLLLAHVRVGSYEVDSVGQDSLVLPLEDDRLAVQRVAWRATDTAYKMATAQLNVQRLHQNELPAEERVPSFARTPAMKLWEARPAIAWDGPAMEAEMRRLSAAFRAHPRLQNSAAGVNLQVVEHTLLNTEGSVIRWTRTVAKLDIRASIRTEDGSTVSDGVSIAVNSPAELPSEDQLLSQTENLAARLEARVAAPRQDSYGGPVLFEAPAAATLFADLGSQLGSSQTTATLGDVTVTMGNESTLTHRLNRPVLPPGFTVVDDSTLAEYHGTRLLGSFPVDTQGVQPSRVVLVDHGILKTLLTTRTPRKGLLESNGHDRMSGQAEPGNLFVTCEDRRSMDALRRELLERCRLQGLPYGLVVQSCPQAGGRSAFLTLTLEGPWGAEPGLMVSRLYPDGHLEPVRALLPPEVSPTLFRNIIAAGDDEQVFNRDLPAPMSVVTPSILIDDIDLNTAPMVPRAPDLLSPPPDHD